MKKNALLLLMLLMTVFVKAQTAPLIVGGDLDKFYPVVFKDINWINHIPTEIRLGRSSVHQDNNWKGSLMAKFVFHNTLWGNGARFTDVDIWQRYNKMTTQEVPFIAGYRDASGSSSSYDFIIWLRGNTTYYYDSNVTQNPEIYDGVKNPLPFQEVGGPVHSFKTEVDVNINSWGKTTEGTLYSLNGGLNYMNGSLGIGTLSTGEYRLAVNGKMRTHEIRVETANWPDYVFEKNYSLPSLGELEKYIAQNKRLPEIPSATEAEREGVDLGSMNKLLLKKIEELTLHLISKDKEITELKKLTSKVEDLENKMKLILGSGQK
ncbi:hypothetical protein SAMN05421820_107160 [Pedobacter steynii]|uniref:Uncharacterized protein n=1 Tax=Pedobacter steynii TaxID=430522 RepID=A0A1H0APA2_9SPHI|nr:hypothetical protein [Pedobacter steynii]NQX41298.1 hypothetical protein [Pedobacter steynii]SDN35307.1 hypothetical protein SAMN05421820_107160 [Pedobacter steynii]